MKKLVLMAAILAVVIFANGCADQNKDVAADALAATETEVTVEEVVVEETEVEIDVATTEVDVVTEETAGDAEAAVEAVIEETTAQVDIVTPEAEAAVEDITLKQADSPCPEDCDKACCAVVVIVNGQTIKEKEIAAQVQKQMDQQKKRMPPGMQFPPDYSQQVRTSVVDRKVQQILQEQQMAEQELTVSDDQVLEEIKKIAGQRGQSMEAVEKEIAGMGMTLEDLMEQMRFQVQIKALMEAQGAGVAVTEEEALKFYDENPQHFEVKEQVQASHILIKTEQNATDEQKAEAQKQAQDLLQQVKEGKDFAELAKEHSTCPSSTKGGDLGLFGRGQMVPPFEQAAFTMNVGDVSDVVETRFGYHIIKLTDKKTAGKTPFVEVKERITQHLTQQKQKESWLAFNKTMHDNATIEYSASEQALRDELEKAAAAPKATPIQPAPAPKPVTTE